MPRRPCKPSKKHWLNPSTHSLPPLFHLSALLFLPCFSVTFDAAMIVIITIWTCWIGVESDELHGWGLLLMLMLLLSRILFGLFVDDYLFWYSQIGWVNGRIGLWVVGVVQDTQRFFILLDTDSMSWFDRIIGLILKVIGNQWPLKRLVMNLVILTGLVSVQNDLSLIVNRRTFFFVKLPQDLT